MEEAADAAWTAALEGDLAMAQDWPLSRAETIHRVIALFSAEVSWADAERQAGQREAPVPTGPRVRGSRIVELVSRTPVFFEGPTVAAVETQTEITGRHVVFIGDHMHDQPHGPSLEDVERLAAQAARAAVLYAQARCTGAGAGAEGPWADVTDSIAASGEMQTHGRPARVGGAEAAICAKAGTVVVIDEDSARRAPGATTGEMTSAALKFDIAPWAPGADCTADIGGASCGSGRAASFASAASAGAEAPREVAADCTQARVCQTREGGAEDAMPKAPGAGDAAGPGDASSGSARAAGGAASIAMVMNDAEAPREVAGSSNMQTRGCLTRGGGAEEAVGARADTYAVQEVRWTPWTLGTAAGRILDEDAAPRAPGAGCTAGSGDASSDSKCVAGRTANIAMVGAEAPREVADDCMQTRVCKAHKGGADEDLVADAATCAGLEDNSAPRAPGAEMSEIQDEDAAPRAPGADCTADSVEVNGSSRAAAGCTASTAEAKAGWTASLDVGDQRQFVSVDGQSGGRGTDIEVLPPWYTEAKFDVLDDGLRRETAEAAGCTADLGGGAAQAEAEGAGWTAGLGAGDARRAGAIASSWAHWCRDGAAEHRRDMRCGQDDEPEGLTDKTNVLQVVMSSWSKGCRLLRMERRYEKRLAKALVLADDAEGALLRYAAFSSWSQLCRGHALERRRGGQLARALTIGSGERTGHIADDADRDGHERMDEFDNYCLRIWCALVDRGRDIGPAVQARQDLEAILKESLSWACANHRAGDELIQAKTLSVASDVGPLLDELGIGQVPVSISAVGDDVEGREELTDFDGAAEEVNVHTAADAAAGGPPRPRQPLRRQRRTESKRGSFRQSMDALTAVYDADPSRSAAGVLAVVILARGEEVPPEPPEFGLARIIGFRARRGFAKQKAEEAVAVAWGAITDEHPQRCGVAMMVELLSRFQVSQRGFMRLVEIDPGPRCTWDELATRLALAVPDIATRASCHSSLARLMKADIRHRHGEG